MAFVPAKVAAEIGTSRRSRRTALPIAGTAAGRIEIAGAATAFLVDRAADPVVTIESLSTIARRHRANLELADRTALTEAVVRAIALVDADLVAADLVRSAGRIAAGWRLAHSFYAYLILRAAHAVAEDAIAWAATIIFANATTADLVRATRRLIIHDDAITRVGVATLALGTSDVGAEVDALTGVWILVLAGRTR